MTCHLQIVTILPLPFQLGYFFKNFSCLIAVTRTSNTVLNRSGKNGHTCPDPEFSGKASTFSPLSMTLVVSLS